MKHKQCEWLERYVEDSEEIEDNDESQAWTTTSADHKEAKEILEYIYALKKEIDQYKFMTDRLIENIEAKRETYVYSTTGNSIPDFEDCYCPHGTDWSNCKICKPGDKKI